MVIRSALVVLALGACLAHALGQAPPPPIRPDGPVVPSAPQQTFPQQPIQVEQPIITPETGLAVFDSGESGLSFEGGSYTGLTSWANVDFWIGFTRSQRLPNLVTTSPTGTAQVDAGVLGRAGTSILLGGNTENGDPRSGFKLGWGTWLDDMHEIGIDVGFQFLHGLKEDFNFNSGGDPILARPFSLPNGTPNAALAAFPGLVSGGIAVNVQSDAVWGANIDLREKFLESDGFRMHAIAGYRYLHHSDSLSVDQSLLAISAFSGVPAGSTLFVHDRFAATNQFHGGDFGFLTELDFNRWHISLLTKLAVGYTVRDVDIEGSTVISVPGDTTRTLSGGFLALSSNIGEHRSQSWVVVPEIGVTAAYDWNDYVRLRLGYSFLCWSQIAQAPDQVNLNINPNLFPQGTGVGANTPSFDLNRSDFIVHGINLGIEIRF